MSKYDEVWEVKINKTEYLLGEMEAKVLQDAIASGSRGIVQFSEFIINIPFIEEFYLKSRELKKEYQLEGEVDYLPDLSEEERQKNIERIAQMKKDYGLLLKKI
jgi:hypothetical protein